MVGICLIRLEHMRLKGFPSGLGLASENAAHRIAVTWGEEQDGVYVVRRDTDSLINHVAGGRLFPGDQHGANFRVEDDGNLIGLDMHSNDGKVQIRIEGQAAQEFNRDSVFESLADASKFFERGELGFSPASQEHKLDGLRLKVSEWHVQPFAVSRAESSYFEDLSRNHPGSVEFDHALLMRDMAHEWHPVSVAMTTNG